ncbi:MAG TPA: DUF1003 domain-containing protein [Polyangia bacterium]|nr:DUF1003 domain-containing protein [Polyangia bacterium]
MAEAQHLRADPADPNKARFGERVTDRVAAFAGSWGFVGASIGAMVLSVLANTVGGMHYDPYPFIALNLAISVGTFVLGSVIMMSQNRQAEQDRARSQADYDINVKAETEIRALHEKLDHMQAQLSRRAAKHKHSRTR